MRKVFKFSQDKEKNFATTIWNFLHSKDSKKSSFRGNYSRHLNFICKAYYYHLMPRPSTGLKIFWAGLNFLGQTKNWYSLCASLKHFVPHQKMISIQQIWFLCWHKSFWRGSKYNQIFELAQKIWTNHFGICRRTRHLCFYHHFEIHLFQKYIQQLSRKRPKLPYPWRFDKKMWKTMCPGFENGYQTIWWWCCPIKKRKSKAEVSTFHFRTVRGENLWKPLVQRPVSKGSFLNYVGQLEFEDKRLMF